MLLHDDGPASWLLLERTHVLVVVANLETGKCWYPVYKKDTNLSAFLETTFPRHVVLHT